MGKRSETVAMACRDAVAARVGSHGKAISERVSLCLAVVRASTSKNKIYTCAGHILREISSYLKMYKHKVRTMYSRQLNRHTRLKL